ncbi:MAG: hypothetical protein ACK52S_15830, partial [Pirellula sp.]
IYGRSKDVAALKSLKAERSRPYTSLLGLMPAGPHPISPICPSQKLHAYSIDAEVASLPFLTFY